MLRIASAMAARISLCLLVGSKGPCQLRLKGYSYLSWVPQVQLSVEFDSDVC